MRGTLCPNCGHRLAAYRTDRQLSGTREAVLHWAICENCRHVGLTSWSYVDRRSIRSGSTTRPHDDDSAAERHPRAHLILSREDTRGR